MDKKTAMFRAQKLQEDNPKHNGVTPSPLRGIIVLIASRPGGEKKHLGARKGSGGNGLDYVPPLDTPGSVAKTEMKKMRRSGGGTKRRETSKKY